MINTLRALLRRFLPARIRTRYRGWSLTATDHSVTAIRGPERYEAHRQPNIEAALRFGKRRVDDFENTMN